jgi:hypothetical protein
MDAERRTHWRCFWTWPFGHKWVRTVRAGTSFLVCTRCGKESDITSKRLIQRL